MIVFWTIISLIFSLALVLTTLISRGFSFISECFAYVINVALDKSASINLAKLVFALLSICNLPGNINADKEEEYNEEEIQ